MTRIGSYKVSSPTWRAVWTGIGAVGTVLMGVVLFGESLDLARLAGIVGLELDAG
jgi:multidrug transporter EmrE-like cation transporter